jgi:hypothetical protein
MKSLFKVDEDSRVADKVAALGPLANCLVVVADEDGKELIRKSLEKIEAEAKEVLTPQQMEEWLHLRAGVLLAFASGYGTIGEAVKSMYAWLDLVRGKAVHG